MEGRTMGYLETALRRKAGLRWDLVMFSSPGGGGHYQERQSPLSASSAEEEALCAAADRSGLLWEDFSVDDLLDFGSGKEQYGGEEEGLFQVEEAEGNGEEGEERDGPSNSNTTSSSSSAMTFQAAPPSSDPIVPTGDVEDLEWVSRFVDDSYSEFTDAAVTPPLANPAVAKTEAPNAHGASRSSPSKRTWQSCYFSTESVVVVPAKARSKRSRCTAGRVWSLRPPPLLNEPPSSSCSSSSSSSSSSCSGSSSVTSCLLFAVEGDPDTILHYRCGSGPSLNPHQPPHLPPARKKKGRKPKALAEAAEQHPRRRCSHCGIEKTPQWRAGPMGAKTLCNACGVRYKSGRLLPEYRPAGSPTFISHVHSNSHRKVLEIRRCNDLSPAGCSPSPPQAAGVTRPHGVV